MQSRWWDFGGNAIIRADQYANPERVCNHRMLMIYRYIRLTSDRPSQEGWIFSRVPLTATNWEVDASNYVLENYLC